jgi:calcineurin-like phosphoesterase family protein
MTAPVLDISSCWFVSDLHLNHYWVNRKGQPRGVILFERTQFENIRDHDDYIRMSLSDWAKKHEGETLFILGDFGNLDNLNFIKKMRQKHNVTVNFLYGNHDSLSDYDLFADAFDNVYLYPTYIAPRVVISHEPLWPCPDGVINIAGHLHGAELDSRNHITVSINDINYRPIGWKTISKRFAEIDKVSYKFLEEPYIRHYKFTHHKEDVVYDKETKKIDYEKSIEKYNELYGTNLKPRAKKRLEW